VKWEAIFSRVLRPGDPFIEGWPDALTDAFRFPR